MNPLGAVALVLITVVALFIIYRLLTCSCLEITPEMEFQDIFGVAPIKIGEPGREQQQIYVAKRVRMLSLLSQYPDMSALQEAVYPQLNYNLYISAIRVALHFGYSIDVP